MTDVFTDRLAAWRNYTSTPWARIRYAVVAETLRRETALLGGRLRVLDVGGGDAMDSLPLALAGHDVTVLDQSAAWLSAARERAAAAGVEVTTVHGDLADPPDLGEHDLVLCHFVLQYRPAASLAADLAVLARHVRRGGTVSVVVPNPAALVLRRLVVDGPSAALAELDAETTRAVAFDHDVRKIDRAELEPALAAAGLPVVRRYGARTANDLLVDDAPKHDPGWFEELLRLELALCDREPYAAVGAVQQLVSTRG